VPIAPSTVEAARARLPRHAPHRPVLPGRRSAGASHRRRTPTEADRRRAGLSGRRAGVARRARRPAVPRVRQVAAGAPVSVSAPKQPGYNKRLRALAPQIVRLLNIIAFESPSFGDALWLLDGTAVPCGASRETARRSERVRSLRDPAPKRGVSNVATTAGVRRARQRRA